MQIKQNRAVHFRDHDGIVRCGVIRDFERFDDGMILIVQDKTMWHTILDSDIVLKVSPRWCD